MHPCQASTINVAGVPPSESTVCPGTGDSVSSRINKTLQKASNSNTSLNVEKLPWAEKLQVGV